MYWNEFFWKSENGSSKIDADTNTKESAKGTSLDGAIYELTNKNGKKIDTLEIKNNEATIENIKTMINRSVAFWEKYGPVTVDGFTFETAGYTETVNSGDGDYLTSDTMWDFKVSKSKLTNKHTLQLLMYWIMGQHSGKSEFTTIKRLGIFNPRLNTAYLLDISAVSNEIIKEVETKVICYK